MRSHKFALHSEGVNEDQIEDGAYTGAERQVLRKALQASGMSARQAATKMDISDTRLRHIINGYQPAGRGQKIAVVAPEDTLARIAMALDVTPEELERAGRRDAANELRARQRELISIGDDSGTVVEAIAAWAEDPVNYIPPDDALRFFDDSALLGELERRLGRLREHARGEVKHGYWDTSGHPFVEDQKYDVLGNDDESMSAVDDEIPAAAKKGDLEEPGEHSI